MALLTNAYATRRRLAPAGSWLARVREIDLYSPNAARMHDFFMGNAHNWAPDRELASQVMNLVPAREAAHANRRFVARAVRYLAHLGVDQYLDLGAGIPGAGHIHGITRRIRPAAKVVYVDNDPVVAASWALALHREPDVAFVQADFRMASEVVDHLRTRRLLDLTRPIAVILSASLDHVQGDAADIIARYGKALCPGSYLAVSHVTADLAPAAMATVVNLYRATRTPLVPRTRTEVTALFAEFDLLLPGVTDPVSWLPDEPDQPGPCLLYWAALGRTR